MKISYFLKPGGHILMARIWINSKPKDKSTGIDTTGEEFDLRSRRFRMRTPNSVNLNAKLTAFEQEIYGVILSGGEIRKEKIALDGDLTLSKLIEIYKQRLDANQVLNKKTGRPLAYETKYMLLRDIEQIKRYLNNGIDFNFTRLNASVPGSQQGYSDFIASLKSHLSDLQNNTIESYLSRWKKIIKHVCKLKGIEVGSLLDDLRVNHQEKDVVILDQDQIDFIISEYDRIVEECRPAPFLERKVMQYWLAALILNPRRKDMTMWTSDNLYLKGDDTWIKYIPHKSKGSSGKWIDVPVYDQRLVEIFRSNIKKYKGKLLPPVSGFKPSEVMKRIAKRYPIFHREVQIEKGGKIVKQEMWQVIKLHQMRASGASDKIMKGVPETVVKSFTGHTVDSKSWARYIKVLNSSKEHYAKILASGISDQLQTKANQDLHDTCE